MEKRVAQVFGSSIDLNGKPGSDNVHVPGVKKTGRGKGWRKGLGKNQLAQKQLVLNLESGVAQNSEGAAPNPERDVALLDGKKRRLRRLPMVGRTRGRGEAKLRLGKRSKQQRMVSSEATRSESATETDPDLPQWAREGRSKRDESEEEDSDIPIDQNVLPDLLKSAKPKERNRDQRTRNETEKHRRPAIKRPRIHQQLQLLDQKKADAKQIETRHCSSSEETESDRELPRQYRFVASDAMLRRMHTKLPVQRTIIDPDAVHSTAQGVLRNLPLVGDPSDDSETKSDDNTGGLIGTSASNSSPALQKAAQFSVNQLKSERSKSFPELAKAVQDLLKAQLLRKAENVTSGKCHVRSSLTGSTSVCSPASNVDSLSALTKKHPSGEPLPRTVVQRAKFTRLPQVSSLASRVETDQALTGGRAKREVTFPLQIGALTIVSLGAVVTDSEHFHDDQYIWPKGYTSIRTFPSAKDPDILVEYKLQVFRNPLSRSHPSFRVTPADDTPVEGPSPNACWQRAFQRLRMAHERVGKIPELGVQFRSPAHMFGFSYPRVSKMIQSLPNARACTRFTNWSVTAPRDEDVEHVLPAGYLPVDISWKHLDRCTVCYVDEEYVGNLLLQCDKCRIMVHMNCYGEVKYPDGNLWLCNLCRPGAPKTRPPCCLCPVTSGGMIKTTDGRWCHIMCAMWIPETYLVDGTEPVDGVSAVAKERWRLTCSICKVPYGACIQCSVTSCRTAFHPLCARSAGLHMEVLEEKRKSDLRFLAYCLNHKQPTNRTREVEQPTPLSKSGELPLNASGCARSEPYNAAARRGRREPEALAAALAKRLFVENLPYIVTGCRQISPLKTAGCAYGAESGEDVEILSTSEKLCRMKSSLRQRLVFGKSAIHGMGVFTKQMHRANDMMIEYVGEVIRPVIADLREKRCYDSIVGAGTYMFRVDDERVVDATRAGNIAHLMNHSCEPNCYSRIVTASGKDRIIIFAKRKIEIGEELTYDYRLMSKDDALTCNCGCVGCRGSVDVVDSNGDLNRLSVPLADLIKFPATTRGHTH